MPTSVQTQQKPTATLGHRDIAEEQTHTCSQPADLDHNIEALLQQTPLCAWGPISQLLDHVKEDLKQHNRGGVIEEGLSLHQHHNLVQPSACGKRKLTRSQKGNWICLGRVVSFT